MVREQLKSMWGEQSPFLAIAQTPHGYAYIKTAAVAAFMRIGLGYAWKKYGDQFLDEGERLYGSSPAKESE